MNFKRNLSRDDVPVMLRSHGTSMAEPCIAVLKASEMPARADQKSKGAEAGRTSTISWKSRLVADATNAKDPNLS